MPYRPPPPLATALMLVAGLFGGCDQQRAAKLEEGWSTEADVRQQFGEPAQIVEHADGSKRLDYPRQPEGWTNYAIEIGADGKMSSLRQLLNPENFARVQAGLGQDAVRTLLGRPAKVWRFPTRPDEEIWDWHFQDGQAKKDFSVTFGPARTVTGTAITDDPRGDSSGH